MLSISFPCKGSGGRNGWDSTFLENELAQLAEDHPLRQWGSTTTERQDIGNYPDTDNEEKEDISQQTSRRTVIPVDLKIDWEEQDETEGKEQQAAAQPERSINDDDWDDEYETQTTYPPAKHDNDEGLDKETRDLLDGSSQHPATQSGTEVLVNLSDGMQAVGNVTRNNVLKNNSQTVPIIDSESNAFGKLVEQDSKTTPVDDNNETKPIMEPNVTSKINDTGESGQNSKEEALQTTNWNNVHDHDLSKFGDENYATDNNINAHENHNLNDESSSEYETDSDDGSVEQVTISLASLIQSNDKGSSKGPDGSQNEPEVIECSLTDLVLGTESMTIRNILASWKGQETTDEFKTDARGTGDGTCPSSARKEALEHDGTENGKEEEQKATPEIKSASSIRSNDTTPASTSKSKAVSDDPNRSSSDNADVKERMIAKAKRISSLRENLNAYAPSFQPVNATTRDPYDFSPDEYYQPYSNGYIAHSPYSSVDYSPVPSTTNSTAQQSYPTNIATSEYENASPDPSYSSAVATDPSFANPYIHCSETTGPGSYSMNGTVYYQTDATYYQATTQTQIPYLWMN